MEKLGIADGVEIVQDNDVLDTWFSSWLWPLTTMGWLEDGKKETTGDLEKFFPTDLLVTAPDIIFFWVARMIMATMKFKNEIPFRDVYFTSTIRDGQGRKLSKSLGNSPDPLNIISKYGADAVRFTIIYLSPLGQDIRMEVDVKAQDIPSMEIGRNFANKVWNAGRFLKMNKDKIIGENLDNNGSDFTSSNYNLSFADKWILSRYYSTTQRLHESLDNYKVNEYSKLLYDFVWRDYCDWYIEILKVQLVNSDVNFDAYYNISFAIEIFEGILKLLHPIMPFITEEIWHLLDESRTEGDSINLQPYPITNTELINNELENEFYFLQIIFDEIRRIRSLLQIPPQEKLPLTLSCKNQELVEFFQAEELLFSRLVNSEPVKIGVQLNKPQMSVTSVVREVEIHIQLNSSIDLAKERERLQKEIQRLEKNISIIERKLANEKFILNAPENIIANEREKLESMTGTVEKIRTNLNSLMN
jgi:valyl-tRNA synthetase